MSAFETACFDKTVLPGEFVESAKSCVQKSCMFVVKDGETVAAIARTARETETHISVSGVYTRPYFRGRGFATALAAQLNHRIFNRKNTPFVCRLVQSLFKPHLFKIRF